MGGQAFVVYKDISCATNAMRALQGFAFLDKPLRIAYSKSKSDIVAQEDGTFKPRGKAGEKLKEEEEKAAAKAKAPPGRPQAEPKKNAEKPAPKMMPHPGAAPQKEAGEKEQPSNVLFVEN